MKQVNVKKLILPNIPYVFIALLATKVSEAVRLAPGSDASTKLLNIMTGLNTAFHSLVPSFHPIDLCVGVAAAIAIRLAVYIKGKNAKKFRKNLEYGSARWGTAEDIKPYVDPVFENNIILTQTERLTMNSRPKDPKTARNKNVLIVGGSGSGKTRFWLKPNLLQCTSKTYPTSFVVTDPKGDIVVSCGHALQKNGYQIKILNSLNFKKSMHYSPDNRAWANAMSIPANPDAWGTDRNCYLAVNSHPGLVDLFLSQTRKAYAQEQQKTSVRDKLKKPPETTSPKISAKSKAPER